MIGTKLGPYEVTAKLGEGGMGEVWRAHDTKLRRDVAIKVLPPAFVEDRERLARFEREAQLLAQLHHPNIASIFGLEESDGTRALVMELVEGPTLAERLEAGPFSFNECLSVCVQIALALEEAHEKGIVHRDLKPQNIKASIEGKVKILDFGLAKAMDPSAGSAASVADMERSPTLMQSPTLTAVHGTQFGVILGTAAYMSPEQAKGLPIDKRADIWAFGVVMFEMLVGRSLFSGDTVTDTLAGVLKTEIDFSKLPASTPASIRSLLKRCLERNPKNRLRDIGDARLALEEALAAPVRGDAIPAGSTPLPSQEWTRFLPWSIAVAALAFAAWVFMVRGGGEASASHEVTRLELGLPADVEPVAGLAGGFGLAPDGRTMGIIGVREGVRRLFVRPLDRTELLEVNVSAGVNAVAFSPDSRSIAILTGDAQVMRLSLVDQQRAVVAAGAHLGGTLSWGESGIYFTRQGALWLVPTDGGAERQLTRLDEGRSEVLHADALELPGARVVLFSSLTTDAETARIEAVALDGGARSVVIERATSPVWSATGHLLFERENGILAAPLKAKRATVNGPAVPVVRAGQAQALGYGSLGYRLSATGTLVYLPPQYGEKRLVSVARDGVEKELELPPGSYANPRVSPEGKRLLIERSGSVAEVLELARGTRTQLAAPALGTGFSTWTSDGARVVFRRFSLPYWVAADGSGRTGLVPGGSINDYPSAPGPDPDSVLLVRIRAESAGDLFLGSIGGAGPPKALLETPAYEGGPQLSPDGRWLVYQSNTTGQPEIFVRRYPELDRAWQVSEGGGVQTRWSADGREIHYRSGRRMMAAPFDGSGAEPLLGRPSVLFADEYDFGQGLSIANYDVTPDGEFLMLRRTPASGRLHIVLHWDEELKRLIASGGVQ